jgi:hypothetical protein
VLGEAIPIYLRMLDPIADTPHQEGEAVGNTRKTRIDRPGMAVMCEGKAWPGEDEIRGRTGRRGRGRRRE